jgi:hypothetical protein
MNRRVTVSVLTALAYVVALCLGAPTAGAVPAKKLDNNLAALWTKVDSTTVRFGGAFGILCALAMIPAYVVGTPDSPRTLQAAREYYDSGSAFVTANGTLPLLHILFGLAFLGVLVAMLRRASGPSAAVYTAFAGGVFFFAFALTAGGFAAEVAYPAAVVRFGDHYCQIGAVAMIFATSVVIWRTAVLPKTTAALGILGVLPLVHYWIPLPAALSSLVWIFLIGLVMLVAPSGVRATRKRVEDTASRSFVEHHTLGSLTHSGVADLGP